MWGIEPCTCTAFFSTNHRDFHSSLEQQQRQGVKAKVMKRPIVVMMKIAARPVKLVDQASEMDSTQVVVGGPYSALLR